MLYVYLFFAAVLDCFITGVVYISKIGFGSPVDWLWSAATEWKITLFFSDAYNFIKIS